MAELVRASAQGRTIRLKATGSGSGRHLNRDAAPDGGAPQQDEVIPSPEGGGAASQGANYEARPPQQASGEGEGPMVSTSPAGTHIQRDGATSIGSYIERTAGGGSSLSSQVSREMSGAFGYDFSGVSVHNDSAAHNVCRSVGANAFATGNDVYFAAGKYAPGSREGDRLIAHELTHVVQQNGGGVARSIAKKGVTFSTPGDPYETQADAVAETVVAMKYGGGGSKLGTVGRSPSGAAPDVSRDLDSLPSTTLANAIIQRKIAGVPDVQMDIGITLGVAGLVVGVVGLGIGMAAFGGNKLTKTMKELVAQPGDARDSHRAANPWRRQSHQALQLWRGGSIAGRFWYGLQIDWSYNGREISDVSVGFAPGTQNPTFGSSEGELTITDNVGTQANPALGYRFTVDYDPAAGGHYELTGNGRFGANGSSSGTANARSI